MQASLGDVAAGYYGAGALRRNGPVAKAIAGAAQAAAAREDLSLRRLKLRFNLGKQFFFNLHPSAGHVPLDQLQELGSRHEFCNTVPSHRVRALVELLTGPAGFRKVGEKYSTSAHVVNERLNAKFIIGLDTSAPRVTVTKVSTSPLRAHYTALLGGPSQLDLRLKLHGYGVPTHDSMAQPAAQAVVAACNAIGIEAFAESAGDVHLPVGMRLATFRRKHKEIYEGAFRVGNKTVPLKISIKTLRDGKGGPRTEVSGTLPAANADLAELLAAARRRGGGGEEQAEGGAGGERCGTAWWAAVLRAVAAFAEAVNAQG
ncbi:hypothetical protein HYH03_006414 [Edaphochlamys debaryana]|uniref:Uncharacterized protein n=1 Tax=Edaphochlamys debaryana TaxID=47281 RepID=A0A835YDD3_9CHLO|nr:hypothetical protein HYH03_006414 [Edaphochlamys debaryana]|eukprot:KAG2495469.1 hypothetical protein HYH03_006414 [Edaphochlamys debaryana]